MIELLNMDCMEYMAGCEDNAFDLAIVDPPYGIGMDGGSVGYKGFNSFEKKDWDREVPPLEYFDELDRVAEHWIIWGGNYYGLAATRCYVVWDKGEGFKGRTYAECEMAWTNYDRNARIYKRDPLACRDYHMKAHPCQKPVPLYLYLLDEFAKPGQRILDTHLGSGSSAIAAHYFGCDFVGMEIDQDYYTAAVERFNHETKQVAMF